MIAADLEIAESSIKEIRAEYAKTDIDSALEKVQETISKTIHYIRELDTQIRLHKAVEEQYHGMLGQEDVKNQKLRARYDYILERSSHTAGADFMAAHSDELRFLQELLGIKK